MIDLTIAARTSVRRRTALLAGALVVVLAACSSTPAVPTAAACAPGETDGDLLLSQWAEYAVPELIAAFEAAHGVRVVQDFYPSNEELLAKVLTGGASVDVIVPSDYMVSIMIDEDLLLPLDVAAIPNRVNVADTFANPPYDPGLVYTLPYQWGTTGLGINVELLGDVTPSWALLLDPDVAGALPGRVALLDDPREALGAGLYLLGLDPNTTDESEIEAAGELLRGARQWTAAYTSQYAELLVAGEVVVAQGYNGTFLAAFEGDDRFAYVIPVEGATIWTDNLAILASAPHPCTAHAFLDFMMDARNAAALSTVTRYATPNAAAEALLDPELLADPAIYPSDEVRGRLRFLVDTGDVEIRYSDVFERSKS